MKREKWIDYIKVFAVIFIVFHHAGVNIHNSYYYYVPVFFIINGYLFKNYKIKDFLINRLKRLYIPFVISNTIIMASHKVLFKIGVIYDNISNYRLIKGLFKSFLFNIEDTLAAPSWFIFSLFITSFEFLLLYKFSKLFKKSDIILFIMTLFLFGIGIHYDKLLNNYTYCNCAFLTHLFINSIFYYFGYIINKYKIKNYIDKDYLSQLVIIVGSIVILFIVNHFFEFTTDYRGGVFSNYILLLVSSITGFIFLGYIPEWIIKNNKYLVKITDFVGKNTIYILLYHILFFQVASFIEIKLFGISLDNFNNWSNYYGEGNFKYLAIIFGVFFPLLIVYLKNKIKNRVITH